MTFYDTLEEIGLSQILDIPEYNPIKFENAEKIYASIDDFRKNNSKVLIYGDYDADGCMCVKDWVLFMQWVGHTNYEIYEYADRMHTLDPGAVKQAIEGDFQYILVNDTGSSELGENGLITKLLAHDIKVIIIDHHFTAYNYEDYPENCAIVNNVIENRMHPENVEVIVSAGCLVYLILDYYLKSRNIVKYTAQMACYALVSLYADSIDMSSELNRAIYYEAMTIRDYGKVPLDIQIFIEKYTTFCRHFIEYGYAPKINCCFRNEMFGVLNDYLECTHDSVMIMTGKVKLISELHLQTAKLIGEVVEKIEYEVLNNFVIANLNSVANEYDIEQTRLYNFTGLIANKLAERHGKCCVVWCARNGKIRGSFRDLQSRNYLPIFKQFCKADGHPPAFGFSLSLWQYNSFIESIKRVDKYFYLEDANNKPIIIGHPGLLPDTTLLQDIARYNEFSGSRIPLALIKKRMTADIRETVSSYGYKYRWGNFNISSPRRIKKGEEMLIYPYRNISLRMKVL